jgi:hypothetical protein
MTGLLMSFGIYSQSTFDKGNYFRYAVLIIPFLLFACFKGARSMGRFLEITFLFPMIALIILLSLGMTSAEWENAGPVLKDGIGPMFSGLRFFASSSGDLAALLMFSGRIAKCKRFGLKLFLTAGVSILLSAAFLLIYIACYGPIAKYLTYAPAHVAELPLEMVQLGKLESILTLAISIFGYTKLYIFFTCVSDAARQTFELKRKNKIPEYVLLLASAVVPVFFPNLASLGEDLGVFSYILLLPAIIIPLLAALLSLFSKKKQNIGVLAEKANEAP